MSKFQGIINANRKAPAGAESPAVAAAPAPPDPPPAPPAAPAPPRRGRPPGKRSSEDHEQVTAYLRRETYRKVRLALIEDGDVQDFSTLVDGLLTDWLRSRT